MNDNYPPKTPPSNQLSERLQRALKQLEEVIIFDNEPPPKKEENDSTKKQK